MLDDGDVVDDVDGDDVDGNVVDVVDVDDVDDVVSWEKVPV